MRVIITGGTGLIGQALASSFAGDGHEVIVLTRRPGAARDLPRGVRAMAWDAASAQGWGREAEGAGAIINLAGENLSNGRWTASRKARHLSSRVKAGQAVTDAVRAAGQKPGVVIQASAVGYYGNRGDEIVTEATPAGRDEMAQLCVAWEESTRAVEELGVRRAIIRTGLLFDRRGGAFPPLILPFRFFAGGRLGSGRQWWPWVHWLDEVKMIRFLVEHPKGQGPFNLGSPNPATNGTIARTLGRVMHRPAWFPVPAFALRLVLGEMATMLLDSQRMVPERLLKLGYEFAYPDLEPALRELLLD